MAIGKSNTGGGGTGGTLTVNAPAGVTVTAAKDGKTYTRTANAQGVAVFKGLATGTWTVTISDGVQNPTTQNVQITADYEMTIAFFSATITVTYPAGSTCTCSKGSTVLTAPNTSGSYTFTVPETGTWTVSCTDGTDTASQSVEITEDGQSESVALSYYTYASDFDWTSYGTLGVDYEILDENNEALPQSQWATYKNWKARLLTSNTLVPRKPVKIDVFMGGAGGGAANYNGSTGAPGAGGGGGYVLTELGIELTANEEYPIVIGAPGAGGGTSGNGNDGRDGGNTIAFGYTAPGGKGGKYSGTGGNGGSGGAGSKTDFVQGGRNGSDGKDGDRPGGTGSGKTTKEFGESNGRQYADGGDCWNKKTRVSNSCNGGSSNYGATGEGGLSGIVVIRPAKEDA